MYFNHVPILKIRINTLQKIFWKRPEKLQIRCLHNDNFPELSIREFLSDIKKPVVPRLPYSHKLTHHIILFFFFLRLKTGLKG